MLLMILLAVLLMGVGIYMMRTPHAGKTTGKITVVVSGYVPYTLVNELGREGLAVEMLLPPGAEPHAFEPAPGDMVAVHSADLFVYVSDEIEPWAKDVLGAAGKQTRVVALAAGLPSTDDPHVWMDFDNIRTMARVLVQALTQADPEYQAVYRENLARFEKEIQTLDNDFKTQLAHCQSRQVVHVGHLAFAALAKRYGLTLEALAGASHEGEHSVRKLADFIQHIRQAKVKALFTEEAISPRLAQTVAAETGTDIFTLYTIEHISKDDFNRSVSYEDLMRRNLENLKQGLVCHP